MPLIFREPLLSDRAAVCCAAASSCAKENDAAFASIYLLREKYSITLCFEGEMLLRRYQSGFRAGCYGFPLGKGDLREAFSLLYADAAAQELPLRLTLLTKAQCELLSQLYPDGFLFTPAEDYTEYLYLRQNIAELRGSKYHKKRNHIAQFWRQNPEAYIQPLVAENVEYAVEIARRWLAVRENPQAPSLQIEFQAICETAANWNALGMTGLLLYAKPDEPPIGMTAGSEISPGIFDVHFEKVVPEQPHAFPVVANELAKCLQNIEYLNREEDLGESGMRSAKQSYHPDLLNEKWTALWVGREAAIC